MLRAHTGDLGSMDKYGYCRVQGRLKDLIIRSGENIYPREVEDVLFTHPSIGSVAVVGVPDREWGEIVVAFVQTKAATDEATLAAFCRGGLHPTRSLASGASSNSFRRPHLARPRNSCCGSSI